MNDYKFNTYYIHRSFCSIPSYRKQQLPLDVVELFKPAPHVDIDETEDPACIETSTRILKVLSYAFTFIVVLVSAVISRSSLLLMTSQLDMPHGEHMMTAVFVPHGKDDQGFRNNLPTRPVCMNGMQGASVSLYYVLLACLACVAMLQA